MVGNSRPGEWLTSIISDRCGGSSKTFKSALAPSRCKLVDGIDDGDHASRPRLRSSQKTRNRAAYVVNANDGVELCQVCSLITRSTVSSRPAPAQQYGARPMVGGLRQVTWPSAPPPIAGRDWPAQSAPMRYAKVALPMPGGPPISQACAIRPALVGIEERLLCFGMPNSAVVTRGNFVSPSSSSEVSAVDVSAIPSVSGLKAVP
jgi:hypothetical protein